MALVVALSRHAGLRVGEVGFLVIVIAGVWLVASETVPPVERWRRLRTIGAGLALAIAGLLLVIATHWGHFGTSR
jgi:hypothetical protein